MENMVTILRRGIQLPEVLQFERDFEHPGNEPAFVAWAPQETLHGAHSTTLRINLVGGQLSFHWQNMVREPVRVKRKTRNYYTPDVRWNSHLFSVYRRIGRQATTAAEPVTTLNHGFSVNLPVVVEGKRKLQRKKEYRPLSTAKVYRQSALKILERIAARKFVLKSGERDGHHFEKMAEAVKAHFNALRK